MGRLAAIVNPRPPKRATPSAHPTYHLLKAQVGGAPMKGMAVDTETRKEPLQLCETQDGDRNVVVRPADMDLFVRTGKQVIEACKLGIKLEVWLDEVHSMVEEIRAWASERQCIAYCLLRPKGLKLVLFVVPRCAQFDFDLADELAEFNLKLMTRFNVGAVELIQIPDAEIDRFLEVESAVRVYG